jgi:hypothetical protein
MDFRYDEKRGLALPNRTSFGGVFVVEHYRNGELLHRQESSNLVVNQGLDYLLDVGLSAASALTSWYVGLFKGNATPSSTDTAQNVNTRLTELTEYTQGARVAWTEAGVSSQTITNAASKAVFDINAAVTAYGAFLCSAQTHGNDGASAKLLAASRFGTSRSLEDGDQLQITYQISAQDAG